MSVAGMTGRVVQRPRLLEVPQGIREFPHCQLRGADDSVADAHGCRIARPFRRSKKLRSRGTLLGRFASDVVGSPYPI